MQPRKVQEQLITLWWEKNLKLELASYFPLPKTKFKHVQSNPRICELKYNDKPHFLHATAIKVCHHLWILVGA